MAAEEAAAGGLKRPRLIPPPTLLMARGDTTWNNAGRWLWSWVACHLSAAEIALLECVAHYIAHDDDWSMAIERDAKKAFDGVRADLHQLRRDAFPGELPWRKTRYLAMAFHRGLVGCSMNGALWTRYPGIVYQTLYKERIECAYCEGMRDKRTLLPISDRCQPAVIARGTVPEMAALYCVWKSLSARYPWNADAERGTWSVPIRSLLGDIPKGEIKSAKKLRDTLCLLPFLLFANVSNPMDSWISWVFEYSLWKLDAYEYTSYDGERKAVLVRTLNPGHPGSLRISVAHGSMAIPASFDSRKYLNQTNETTRKRSLRLDHQL